MYGKHSLRYMRPKLWNKLKVRAKLEVSPPLGILKHTFVDTTLMHYWKQSAKGAPFVAHDWVRMPPPPCFFPFIMSIFPVPYGFRF